MGGVPIGSSASRLGGSGSRPQQAGRGERPSEALGPVRRRQATEDGGGDGRPSLPPDHHLPAPPSHHACTTQPPQEAARQGQPAHQRDVDLVDPQRRAGRATSSGRAHGEQVQSVRGCEALRAPVQVRHAVRPRADRAASRNRRMRTIGPGTGACRARAGKRVGRQAAWVQGAGGGRYSGGCYRRGELREAKGERSTRGQFQHFQRGRQGAGRRGGRRKVW